ncbi:putative membrane protein YesL [Arthrobacter pascens]|nr:putative membrane protein YesL [Arthrobacter pascens]
MPSSQVQSCNDSSSRLTCRLFGVYIFEKPITNVTWTTMASVPAMKKNRKEHAMMAGTFSARSYSFFDTLFWIACLNLLWIASTLLGLVILGVGPATAAAQILVRRRVRGDAAPLLRAFVAEYMRNLVPANLLALPVLVVAVALALNWNYFGGAADLLSQLIAAGTVVGAIFLAAVVCYLFPMYARYELPPGRHLMMSSRFAVRHLAGTVILLFVSAASIYASRALPGLIPFFSIGAWLFVTGWLCDRFFTANDESVAALAALQENLTDDGGHIHVSSRSAMKSPTSKAVVHRGASVT